MYALPPIGESVSAMKDFVVREADDIREAAIGLLMFGESLPHCPELLSTENLARTLDLLDDIRDSVRRLARG